MLQLCGLPFMPLCVGGFLRFIKIHIVQLIKTLSTIYMNFSRNPWPRNSGSYE